jgi:hypothetical protein
MSLREPERMSRRDYLFGMNDIAMYAASRGSPLLLPSHVAFLVAYVREWLRLEPGPDNERAVIGALFHRAPRWARHLSVRLHRAQWIPRKVRLPLLLTPLFIPLAVILPCQLVWAGVYSAWDILRKGVRSVPPMVTAVVVVFVTSDAWRILGTGFTVRFFILVCAFLTASLLFLVREDWWADVSADEDEAKSLLEGMKDWNQATLLQFTRMGAKPVPMERPRGLRGAYAYLAYITLVAFSLIAAALFVSAILIIVGLILINANETRSLAGSAYIYQSYPGITVTKQLLSLSFSLGAFSAFFLVAAQHSDDRDKFMKSVLLRYRRALLAYTTYCRAHDCAAEWTGVPVDLKFCKQRTLEPRRREEPRQREDPVVIPGARATVGHR